VVEIPRMDEDTFVDRLQNHFEQLVPLGLGGGNSQWSQFAVCFRDVDSFDRLRSIFTCQSPEAAPQGVLVPSGDHLHVV